MTKAARIVSLTDAERVVTDVFGPSGQFDDLAETGPSAQRLLGESGAVLGNQAFAFAVASTVGSAPP